jgi:membrane-associated phospholipid phosphatase
MCVSTVYGRYHYMADVLGGLAVGMMGFSVGTRLMRRRERCRAVKVWPRPRNERSRHTLLTDAEHRN